MKSNKTIIFERQPKIKELIRHLMDAVKGWEKGSHDESLPPLVTP